MTEEEPVLGSLLSAARHGVVEATKRAGDRGLEEEDIIREAENADSQFWKDFAEAMREYPQPEGGERGRCRARARRDGLKNRAGLDDGVTMDGAWGTHRAVVAAPATPRTRRALVTGAASTSLIAPNS